MQWRFFLIVITLLLLLALACAPTSTVAPTTTPAAEDPTNEGNGAIPIIKPPTEDVPTGETPTSPPVTEPTATPTSEPTSIPPSPSPTAPPPGPPMLISFTADPMNIVEKDTVTLRWQAQGATEANIWWYDRRAIPAPPVTYTGTPDNGTAVINPDNGPIHLTLRNAHGQTEAEISMTIRCRHTWGPELVANPPGNCPGELVTTWAAQQPFENGWMLWVNRSAHNNEPLIYVFYNNGRWYSYADNFAEGDHEIDPSITPPAGRYQPTRGFGLVWRTYPEVRSGLGWATASESGFETWNQNYMGIGLHNVSTYLRDINQSIYRMEHMGSTWRLHP